MFCHLICIIAVIIYAVINIRSYFQNEDLCEVSFKTFHNEEEDIYPSLTMCINTPFKNNESITFSDNTVNTSTYNSYLLGMGNVRQNLAGIQYKNVSIQLSDFIITAYATDKEFSSRGGIPLRDHITEHNWGIFFTGMMKCFTFNVPFIKDVKMSSIKIDFKNSIFPNDGQRPTDGWDSGGLHLFFHYPNQFSRSFPTNKRFWQVRKSEKNSHRIRFYLKDMEVLRKRQKAHDKCLERDSMEIDDWIRHHVMDEVKCRPPYWHDELISNSSFPVCDTKEKLRQAVQTFFNFFYGSKESNTPCTEIVKLGIEYEERADDDLDSDTSQIVWYYRTNTFKEIKQMRAYSGMMLIGNVGGFFGILLGYAFVQVPGFLSIVHKSFWTISSDIKTEKRVYPMV